MISELMCPKDSVELAFYAFERGQQGDILVREQMAKVENLGRYYRNTVDNWDLNCSNLCVEGVLELSTLDDRASHNAERLGAKDVRKLLTRNKFIREQLGA